MKNEIDLLKLCKELIENHFEECNLSNEGEMGAYEIKTTGDIITIYNDGYQCCALFNDTYVVGKDMGNYNYDVKLQVEEIKNLLKGE